MALSPHTYINRLNQLVADQKNRAEVIKARLDVVKAWRKENSNVQFEAYKTAQTCKLSNHFSVDYSGFANLNSSTSATASNTLLHQYGETITEILYNDLICDTVQINNQSIEEELSYLIKKFRRTRSKKVADRINEIKVELKKKLRKTETRIVSIKKLICYITTINRKRSYRKIIRFLFKNLDDSHIQRHGTNTGNVSIPLLVPNRLIFHDNESKIRRQTYNRTS